MTRAKKTGDKTGKATVMRSPRNGASCPTGAHPGNTGGKKGRSGRRPDAFRELLATIRDEAGISALRYALKRGKPDTRLRGMELLCKHTLPAEKVIRLEGLKDAQYLVDVIKERIRTRLDPVTATELIEDINSALKEARI